MALESLGCGFDVASDFRLKFVRKCPHEHGGKLVVLDETRKRDIVLPGGGVVCDVVEDIKCDKGDRIRFKSHVLEFSKVRICVAFFF